MRWKAPPSDPWQDDEAGGPDPWVTFSLLVGVIVLALVMLLVVGAVYAYLVVTRSR